MKASLLPVYYRWGNGYISVPLVYGKNKPHSIGHSCVMDYRHSIFLILREPCACNEPISVSTAVTENIS